MGAVICYIGYIKHGNFPAGIKENVFIVAWAPELNWLNSVGVMTWEQYEQRTPRVVAVTYFVFFRLIRLEKGRDMYMKLRRGQYTYLGSRIHIVVLIYFCGYASI
jgi:hypothetical protein